jgi:DNA-binding NarL/FixJ family response regulator
MSQPGGGQSSASSGSAGHRIHDETRADAEPLKWLDDLTHRERDIFSLVAAGYDNDQIADKLNLAIQTVRNQVSTIYAKLGVKDRFEIIRLVNRMP